MDYRTFLRKLYSKMRTVAEVKSIEDLRRALNENFYSQIMHT